MKRYKFFFVVGMSISTHSYAVLENYRALRAYKHDQLEEAQQLLESVFIADQHNADAAYNLGKVAYKKGQFSEAEVYFVQAAEAAVEKQLQIQAFFDAGNARVKQEKWEDALKSYQEVVARDVHHQYAQEMIDQLKKLLEEKKQEQQQQQQQRDQQQQKNDQQQENQQQKENKQDNQQKEKNDQEKSNEHHEDTQRNEGNKDQKDTTSDLNKEEEQRQKEEKEKSESEQKNKEQESEADKKEGAQERNNQNTHDDFEENERKDKGEQKREQGKEKQENQQAQGQIGDMSPDGVGDNKDNSKNHDAGQHNNKPSPCAQASPQDTQKEEKEQDFEDKPKTAEELLLSLLEERDAELVKEMLKVQVKQEMPRKHGQKNW